jgi:hypothetical protein
MKEFIQLVLNTENHPLVVADSASTESAVLIGCLRKIQNWALTSILYEYGQFVPGVAKYDINRQYIEKFDVSLICLPEQQPSWLRVHYDQLELERPGSEGEESYYSSEICAPLVSSKVTPEQMISVVNNDDD